MPFSRASRRNCSSSLRKNGARGHAAPGWPASYADDGRLQQQGWLIRNTQDADTRLPRRLELEREGMSIRLVFSRWQWQTEPQP